MRATVLPVTDDAAPSARPGPALALPPVELRVPADADAAAWHTLFDHPEVMRYIGSGELRPPEWYGEFVRHQQRLAAETGLCLFSVVHAGRVVGFAGVQPWRPQWGPHGVPELGWRLGRAHWGKGYVAAATRLAVAAAAGRGVPRLVSMINAGNERSRAVARRLGMTEAATHTSPTGLPFLEYELAPARPGPPD